MKETIEALAPAAEGSERILRSPTVGRWFDPPPVGTFLSPGFPIGRLRVLSRTYLLLVPEGVTGVLAEAVLAPPAAVEYAQPLLRVVRGVDAIATEEVAVATAATDDLSIPPGMTAVRSPTDGIFYRRPSPEEPSYVEEGEEVETGRVVGLVEVMKCFNQIRTTRGGRIARILVEDAEEVRFDQALLLIE